MQNIKRIKQVNPGKRKRNMIMIVLALLVFACVVISFVGAAPKLNTEPSDVNLNEFIKLNKDIYSHLQATEVPTYETRNKEIKKMVVIADFNAHVQGGEQHIVTCKDTSKNCNKPKNRNLILLDKRQDKEALYYKKLLKEDK